MIEIWLQHKEDAENIDKLRMIAVANKFPDSAYAAIVAHNYSVVPNTVDGRGGVFVRIGGGGEPSPTPPQKKIELVIPMSRIDELSSAIYRFVTNPRKMKASRDADFFRASCAKCGTGFESRSLSEAAGMLMISRQAAVAVGIGGVPACPKCQQQICRIELVNMTDEEATSVSGALSPSTSSSAHPNSSSKSSNAGKSGCLVLIIGFILIVATGICIAALVR